LATLGGPFSWIFQQRQEYKSLEFAFLVTIPKKMRTGAELSQEAIAQK
jgi:hypothetical protein